MANQIGISFMPNEEQAALGPMRGAAEGDLQQAWKILSMRLPRILGARAPAQRSLLEGPGMGDMSPAVLRALAQTAIGRGPMGPMGPGGPPDDGGYGPVPPQAPKPSVHYAPRPGDRMGDFDYPSRRGPFGGPLGRMQRI